MGQMRAAYRTLLGLLEGKRPLRRPRHRGEDNINMDVLEVVWRGMDWVDLAKDKDRWRAVVYAGMNFLGP
jgi:hypothetical protein